MLSNVHNAVDMVYRSDWGRIVASLIRTFGDFDVAEEAAQEAFALAVKDWPSIGVPNSPAAWIIQTARHKAIDRIRRQSVLKEKLKSIAPTELVAVEESDSEPIPDDRLAADLYLLPSVARSRSPGPFDAPHVGRAGNRRDRAGVSGSDRDDGPASGAGQTEDSRRRHSVPRARYQRHAGTLDAVLTVIYLIYNEGYSATRGNRSSEPTSPPRPFGWGGCSEL